MPNQTFGKNVDDAVRAAAIATLDERGLMSLADARALVSAAKEFRKGEGTMVHGAQVLESDRLWAALLSLEDADEFVREATRLHWMFHPRGKDNLAPLERYGRAILPWLERFVLPDGRLINVPWCVKPCLIALEGDGVFDLIWRVRTVVEGTGSEWPGPFAAGNAGDADKRAATELAAAPPAKPDDTADGLVRMWVTNHLSAGLPRVARLALEGDTRAAALLAAIARNNPSRAFECVRLALGEADARAAFARAHVPTELTEAAILEKLHENAAAGKWPRLYGNDGKGAYHAMRMIAVRETKGDGWGLLFERIQGDTIDNVGVAHYLNGTVRNGELKTDRWFGLTIWPEEESEDDEPSDPYDLDGIELIGPAGPLELSPSMVTDRDLRAGWVTADGVLSSRFSVLLRAYLSVHPDAFWGDSREAAKLCGLDSDVEVLLVSTAFEHVVGGAGPATYDASWLKSPKESPVFQSLARALVARDGTLFDAGKSNLDYRLHALSRAEGDRKRAQSKAVLDAHGAERREERAEAETDVFLRVHDPDGTTMATMHPNAVGLGAVKSDWSFSPEQDRLFALGWPHLRFLADGWVDDEDPVGSARDRIKFGEPYRLVWARETACRLVRAWGCKKTFFIPGPRKPEVLDAAAEQALELEGPVEVDEAKRIILGQFLGSGSFAKSSVDVAETFVMLLEAMVGPKAVVEGILDALEGLPSAEFAANRRDRLNVVYMLGFLVLRLPRSDGDDVRRRVRDRHEGALREHPKAPLTGMLGLLLHTPEDELFYIDHATDPHFIQRAIDVGRDRFGPSARDGVYDAHHAYLGGQPVLQTFAKRWRERMNTIEQLEYFIATVGTIRAPEVVSMILDIGHTSPGRLAAREWIQEHEDYASSIAGSDPRFESLLQTP